MAQRAPPHREEQKDITTIPRIDGAAGLGKF
jgi:hypothetical protein